MALDSSKFDIAYQLNWSLAVFWRQPMPSPEEWLTLLTKACEPDGIHVLEHHAASAETSLFLISTLPTVSPAFAIQRIKGRLQYLVRARHPSPFQRNYGLYSVGSARAETIDAYVSRQPSHHPMADARVQALVESVQIEQTDPKAGSVQSSAHGRYIHNLHIVLVRKGRWMETRADALLAVRETIISTATENNWRLIRGGILPDHIHLMVGCGIDDTPAEVAATFLECLVAVERRHDFQAGFHLSTFGPYSLADIRSHLKGHR